MKRTVIIGVISIALAACDLSETDRDKLAAAGSIAANAPVIASGTIVIAAPVGKVWKILTDIKEWPTWAPEVERTAIESGPADNVNFSWSTGGTAIHSTIRRFDESAHVIAWTGRAFTIHAVHVWSLSVLPDGRTLVQTRESMDGWLISLFYSSSRLQETHRLWLARLKQTAES